MTKLKDIVLSTKNYWVKRVPGGFEVYKTGHTHSTRVAVIGYVGDEGLERAKREIQRREDADLATAKTPAQVTREINEALARPQKSPSRRRSAQLQREIDETIAPAPTAAFEKAKVEEALLEQEVTEAEAALKSFPRGPMGLTPDSVRATSEWRTAKARFDKAFARLRAFNAFFVKKFEKERRAERAARTRARERS
jgi:hypothetical protein